MNRSDLVEALAERFAPLPQRDAEAAVRLILGMMTDALARGHRVEVRNFGRFAIKHRPPRTGRNPRTGESVAVPEKRTPHFKPGKALREAVDRALAQA
jgi:integration host factor subunit beta